MKKSDSLLKFASWKAALDPWVGMIGATLDLKTTADKELYLPVTIERYTLMGRDWPVHTKHDDSEVREDRSH